jgi:hypothetical protein
MALQIDLPVEVQREVERLARQRGKKVEDVVAAAVKDYLAAERAPLAPEIHYQAAEESQVVYRVFKERLRERYHIDGDLTPEEIAATMNDLSEKVAAGMAFRTWQETEAFMRGEDDHDLPRQ